ncbi:MAG TPA: M23 family metallopeptidase [Clostridiaceae bacterium]|jgi:murein DD-endopeptidase MepM/ murein hydrolase activator NlpD|nr:M23 family metallopeptidase [Clostridiaceae bacterium]
MNNKRMFPEKKQPKKILQEFLDRKGFFIVLVLCICVVSATIYYVTRFNAEPPVDDQYGLDDILTKDPTGGLESTDLTNQTDETPDVLTESTNENALASSATDPAVAEGGGDTEVSNASLDSEDGNESEDTATSSVDTATFQEKEESVPAFAMPVYGTVLTSFAMDKLVYSKTLEEWRTHSGVDIAASRGTAVKAVADGVVSDIKNDPRYGVTIIIDHENGWKTLYANLASGDVVLPNQKVGKGDIIGSVGSTAAFESMDPSHLHFEVLKDNEPVDPAAYLPDISNTSK